MGASAASVGVAVRTLLIVFFCVCFAAYVYLFTYGDFSTCYDVNARWWLQLTADFDVFDVVIGAWIAYKESSWIIAFVLVAVQNATGSLVPIGYMLLQFHKLSREESLTDPLYFVLARHEKRDVMEHTSKRAVYVARAIFLILSGLFVGLLTYTFIVDISPSYNKYFSKCIITFIVDVYIYVGILSVWIGYKESSWMSASIWIVLLLCFRSLTLCVYMARQLFYLSPHEPVSLIIFNSRNRDLQLSDPLMRANQVTIAHGNV